MAESATHENKWNEISRLDFEIGCKLQIFIYRGIKPK